MTRKAAYIVSGFVALVVALLFWRSTFEITPVLGGRAIARMNVWTGRVDLCVPRADERFQCLPEASGPEAKEPRYLNHAAPAPQPAPEGDEPWSHDPIVPDPPPDADQ